MKRSITATVAAGVLLVSAGCGGDDDTTDDTTTDTAETAPAAGAVPDTTATATTATTTSAAETTTANTTSGTPAAEGGITVAVAENDELGELLTDGEGRTLYLFTADDGTTTACTGDCAANWPPLDGAEPGAGDGIDAALLDTAATEIAENHVTYNGHLLYYFAGDAVAGDTNGVGIPQWFAVDPTGEAIGDDAAPAPNTDADYGY